jgi:hypothetical protein
MNVALTILGSVGLLVLGQIVIRSFIDPIYELRKLRGEIANALIYHANVYMYSGHTFKTPEIDTARHALRSLGSQLEARSYAVPFYPFFSFVGAVPTLKSIEQARSNLIGLSNAIQTDNTEHKERHVREITEALDLKIPG